MSALHDLTPSFNYNCGYVCFTQKYVHMVVPLLIFPQAQIPLMPLPNVLIKDCVIDTLAYVNVLIDTVEKRVIKVI